MARGAAALLIVLLVGTTACGPAVEPADALHLLQFRQAGRADVALNEPLVFHFSEELEPASVTRESVRILDPRGEPIRGEFSIRRAMLEFRPSLPLRSDLTDGGLRPGAPYSVLLVGFPRPDGLRSRSGAILDRSHRMSFQTARQEDPATLFLDLTSSSKPPTLALVSRELSPLDPILLECGEALDPTSLFPEDFTLLGEGGDGERNERIPLRVGLVENESNRARVELRPLGGNMALETIRALDPGRTYFLLIDRDELHLRTLRRRGLKPFWSADRPVLLTVLGNRVERVVERVVERFEDTSRRSPEPYPGVDGTAFWDPGRRAGSAARGSVEPAGGTPAGPARPPAVRARFPVAAGSGRDGWVVLGEEETRSDLHAVGLSVPAGRVCNVRTGQGLTVLRSQGRLDVAGVLRRRCEPSELGWREDESLSAWRLRTAERKGWRARPLDEALRIKPLSGEPGFTEPWPKVLSEFLARAEELDPAWTILIAGGDLVVTGRIETDGPLLLVAGGWVRVPGRVEAQQVYFLPDGGGNLNPSQSKPVDLFLDEPEGENPLVEPLRLACLSDPIRPSRGEVEWNSLTADLYQPTGRAKVSVLGVREEEGRAIETYGPVTDIELLQGCQFVRFLVELRVDPGERWDPPEVRSVEVTWSLPGSD